MNPVVFFERCSVKVIHADDVAPQPVTEEGACGTTIRWLITKEDGAPHFAMRLFELQPGGATPLHTHEWEHEVFVLQGEGSVWREEGKVPIRAGSVVFVPPGEKHCFENTGTETLRFLCIVPI